MAYQDLTAYTKVDPDGKMTVTTTRLTLASLLENHVAYLGKDFGAGYFNANFNHNFDLNLTSSTTASDTCPTWALSDYLGNWGNIITNSKNEYAIAVYNRDGSTYRLYIAFIVGGTRYEYDGTPYFANYGTTYYCTVRYDSSVGTYGTLYLDIYSDSARSSLITTISHACIASPNFQYVFLTQTNGGPIGPVDGYIENLDLAPVAPSNGNMLLMF